MLLWNGARPEEAVTLLSGYKGKLYCSYPEVLALAEEVGTTGTPEEGCLPQPPWVTHTHSCFSPGRRADTEGAGVDARAHVGIRQRVVRYEEASGGGY